MAVSTFALLKHLTFHARLVNTGPLYLFNTRQSVKPRAWNQMSFPTRLVASASKEGGEPSSKGTSAADSTSSEGTSSDSTSSDSSSSSDDSSSSDEEDETKVKKAQEQSTSPEDTVLSKSRNDHQKLNALLESMLKNDESVSAQLLKGKQNTSTTDFLYAKRAKEDLTPTSSILDKDVESAARNVAESLGGDVKKTESELLSRLLSHSKEMQHAAEKPKTSNINLSDLIVGMKIDRTPASSRPGQEYQSSHRRGQPPKFMKREQPSSTSPHLQPIPKGHLETRLRSKLPPAKVDIYGEEPLGIFTSSSDLSPSPALTTWQHLQQRELRLAVTHPPSNVFEEMILWTEKGMLWKFPINNEQDMKKDADVPFTEHVFMEKHLVPWCPSKGPVRHFMELVCVGLSKNSYFTAEEKKNHILWYRDYFEKKSDILKAVGITLNSEARQEEMM